MRKLLITTALALGIFNLNAQTDSSEKWFVGAEIHTAAGQVFTNGALGIKNGKIIYVGSRDGATTNANTVDISGKRIYPGLIALNSNLGLTEIEAVRATNDFTEVGENNAHVRTSIAFNTDSRVMKTVLANGILMAQVCPQGGLISGQSSVMTLQARNWEEALYVGDNVVHIHWPDFDKKPQALKGGGDAKKEDPNKKAVQQREKIVSWLQQAKSYSYKPTEAKNLRYEALKDAINGKKKVFVHADGVESMIDAVRTLKPLGITPVIVGGKESAMITAFLKENNVAVIISRTQNLPRRVDDSYETSYALPYKLWKDSVSFAISEINFWEQRNLPFEAGQAVGFGLPYEEALKSITIYPAQLLGIEQTTGSLEKGKDATFIITSGDVLDMRSSIVEQAYLQGKDVDLTNPQEELYKKFKAIINKK